MTHSGTISTISLFWNERSKNIARPKAFDRNKAQVQALRLFWRKGFNATSVEDLVETLHLSRSSLYDTFGDKRTLFLGALKVYSNDVLNRVSQALELAPSGHMGIEMIFDELVNSVGKESGAMGCFMVNSIAELTPYDTEVTAIAADYSHAFQKLLAEALAKEEDMAIQGTTAEQWAVYLFNVIQGMRILIKSGSSIDEMRAVSRIALNNLR